jgi:AhpD family alkylhydroperoxidase
MRRLLMGMGFTLLLVSAASAQEPPQFMKQIYPEQALKPAFEEFMAVMNPKGALDGKTKELIGLAVAAQIPCEYCIYYHSKAAKADGATDAQIKEALASGALVRKWSTMLNGSAYDRKKFEQEVDAIFASH